MSNGILGRWEEWTRHFGSGHYLKLSIVLVVSYSFVFGIFVPGWTNDYWDHAAAVKAMSENPWHPSHPLFVGPYSGDRGFNPYLLCLAAISRLTGLSPFQALKVGGVLNLLSLCVGVYLFTSLYFAIPRVAVWVLLGVLFWGTTRGAMLRETAYLPSFFVYSVAFIYWYVLVRYLRERKLSLLALACTIGLALWLSHQLQGGLAIANGAVLAYFEHDNWVARRWAVIGGLPVLVVGLGELWPYFSSLKYTLGNLHDAGYNEPGITFQGALGLYGYVLGPNILAIGLIILCRAETALERFLKVSVMLSGLPLAVLFLVRSQYYGLFIGNMGSMAAIWTGVVIATQQERAFRIGVSHLIGAIQLRRVLMVLLALIILLQVKYTLGWIHQYYWTDKGIQYREMLDSYTRLQQWVGTNDVVVSDRWTSWQLPTFTGKIIMRPDGHQLDYNVPRPELRRRAEEIDLFFDARTSIETRRVLIRRYNAKFVLVNKVSRPDLDAGDFTELGTEVFSSPFLCLIQVSTTVSGIRPEVGSGEKTKDETSHAQSVR